MTTQVSDRLVTLQTQLLTNIQDLDKSLGRITILETTQGSNNTEIETLKTTVASLQTQITNLNAQILLLQATPPAASGLSEKVSVESPPSSAAVVTVASSVLSSTTEVGLEKPYEGMPRSSCVYLPVKSEIDIADRCAKWLGIPREGNLRFFGARSSSNDFFVGTFEKNIMCRKIPSRIEAWVQITKDVERSDQGPLYVGDKVYMDIFNLNRFLDIMVQPKSTRNSKCSIM